MSAYDHLAAVRAVLAPLAYPTHLGFAQPASAQYLVLSGRPWDEPRESSVSADDRALDTEFRVKAVTGTVEGVGIMLDLVRGLLWVNRQPTKVAMSGWDVEVLYLRSEFVDVDQSTTITGTNRHPAFGVDTYRLTAQPTS